MLVLDNRLCKVGITAEKRLRKIDESVRITRLFVLGLAVSLPLTSSGGGGGFGPLCYVQQQAPAVEGLGDWQLSLTQPWQWMKMC